MPSSATLLHDALLLRLGLRDSSAPKPAGRLPFSLLPSGLPLGQVLLLEGTGRSLAVARLLAEHPTQTAVWIEEHLSAYPPGLAQQGVVLERLLFVESGAQWAWVAAQVLRSQVFKIIILASPCKGAEVEAGLRRLQLAAERSQSLVLLLAPPEGPAWAVRRHFECGWQDGALTLKEQGERAQAQGGGA